MQTAPINSTNPDNALAGSLADVALGYQRTLAENPRHPEALAGMALVAMVSRQPEHAVAMAQAAVEVAPVMGPGWVMLGQALRSSERCDEAAAAYREAIRLDGMDPLAHV
ncbi:MAG: hypothetical protein WCE75_15420, partial [Terracidiphilus sp.]